MSEDFKNEESNVPPEKRVEKTTLKNNEENVESFRKLETGSYISDLEKKVDPPKKVKYRILVNDFPKFDLGTNGNKNSIIGKYMRPSEGGYPWYSECYKGFIKHMISNKIEDVLLSQIKIKNSKPVDRNGPTNKRLSLDLIEKYLKINLPLGFLKFDKNQIKPKLGYFVYEGIEIKVNPELIFEGMDKNGNKTIGAVKFNMNKTKPHLSKQGRLIVATLLRNYLEFHYLPKGYIVDPKLCICVDVYGSNYEIAPSGSDVPFKAMQRIATEIKILWEKKE
ncbi:MAG: hypothetical protein HS119_13900 [Flavobacteriales bacterium]|nr:hypothetical protein [Flavobacteriales bacterium]